MLVLGAFIMTNLDSNIIHPHLHLSLMRGRSIFLTDQELRESGGCPRYTCNQINILNR